MAKIGEITISGIDYLIYLFFSLLTGRVQELERIKLGQSDERTINEVRTTELWL